MQEMTRTTSVRMSPKSMIEKLRAEVKVNPVLSAICHIFAVRERARQQVTIPALKQTMMKEGFDFKIADYEKALRFLANIGIGTLELDHNGKAKAIKGIRYTLQSLGAAAINENEKAPKRFAPRNQYADVPQPEQSVPRPPPFAPPRVVQEEPMPRITPTKVSSVALTATINNMPVVFVIADEMEPSQLGQLLVRLSGNNFMPELK